MEGSALSMASGRLKERIQEDPSLNGRVEQIVKNLAGCGKSDFVPRKVIPAKAGIQSLQGILDSRFRGSDGFWGFSATC